MSPLAPAIDALNLVPTNVDPRLDTNPSTRPEIKLYKETLSLAAIDAEELAIFKAQFATLLAMPGSDERKVMLDRIDAYIIALRCIKWELNKVKFTGLNPEDTELGFGLIRPQFTIAGAATTNYKTNWQIALTAAFADWLYCGTGTAFSIGKDFGLVISHLKSLVTPIPFMAECRFEVGRTGILIPQPTRGLRIGDTENGVSIIAVPTMILKPKGSLYAAARADTGNTGTDEIELGGLVIGLGRVLKETTPSWTA